MWPEQIGGIAMRPEVWRPEARKEAGRVAVGQELFVLCFHSD
jgi:hypothetical protein